MGASVVGHANNVEPHWIWTEGHNNSVSFTKSFQIKKKVERATLYVVTNFCDVQVSLNESEPTTVEAYGEPLHLDVTQHLASGVNRLESRAKSCLGPSAIAMRLQIRFGDGSESHLVTDAFWTIDASGEASIVDLGPVAASPWLIAPDSIRINPFDDYTQWKRALDMSAGTHPAAFQVLPGFEIERLRSARPDEGSWISLAIDRKGRIVIGKEDQGILRATMSPDHHEIEHVERINEDLLECRGLLFAHDSLYANANNSKGLYRLRDTNDDDRYDEVKLLHPFPGGVGHGRNDLALGPDGMIYSIHGDSVDVPTEFIDRTSPYRENRRGIKIAEGHVIRTDRDGKTWEMVAAGLRNPFGIDFNADGEMFTYDADAEFDMGSPWYRPTRVNHLVSGGDFGWRGVTGKWPPYFPDHPDNAPANLDIGKGSPTSVKFGDKSSFPPKYQRALFILDWAYGRILAIHMAPRGASYFCRAETFLRGRPLNVTDLEFGPDGAMYFVTGGRKTQSALYRIRYVGPEIDPRKPTRQQRARLEHAKHARQQRHQLEALHRHVGTPAVNQAWPQLASSDPRIRYAARIAIEHQPIELWAERVFTEKRPLAALTAMMALARSGSVPARARILTRLNLLPVGDLPPSNQWMALYTYQLCLLEKATLDAALLTSTIERLGAFDLCVSSHANRLLRAILVMLDVPSIVPRTLDGLLATGDQVNHLHHLFVLRSARRGWNLDRRRTYFRALNETDHYLGGQGMAGFLDNIRRDAVAGLTDKERTVLADLWETPAPGANGVALPVRPLVKEWQLDELADSLDAVGFGRNFEQGRRTYVAALCAHCHRLGSFGKSLGPDLTSVSSRFGRHDILISILEPSRVIAVNHRSHRVITSDGRQLEGRIVHTGDYRAPALKIAADPLAPGRLSEILKAEIESISPSPVSFMPQGLLNTLTQQEILDLLAFIEAAGDENRPNFR